MLSTAFSLSEISQRLSLSLKVEYHCFPSTTQTPPLQYPSFSVVSVSSKEHLPPSQVGEEQRMNRQSPPATHVYTHNQLTEVKIERWGKTEFQRATDQRKINAEQISKTEEQRTKYAYAIALQLRRTRGQFKAENEGQDSEHTSRTVLVASGRV